jgi:hypothetical protein
MPMSERSIFRESAIKRYHQRQEQGTLLHVAYPPAVLFLWIFLLLLVGAGGFVGSIQVPILAQSQGVVVEQGANEQAEAAVMAVLFLSPKQLTDLHIGQPALVSIGPTPINVPSAVEHVDSAIISPNQARSRYNLQGGLAQVITGPSITVTLFIGPAASNQMYAGSLCNAQIQTGSQSALSLLPGFNQLMQEIKGRESR